MWHGWQVYETKLGKAISEKLEIPCIHNECVLEIMRGIRNNMEALLGGTTDQDLQVMAAGACALARAAQAQVLAGQGGHDDCSGDRAA